MMVTGLKSLYQSKPSTDFETFFFFSNATRRLAKQGLDCHIRMRLGLGLVIFNQDFTLDHQNFPVVVKTFFLFFKALNLDELKKST